MQPEQEQTASAKHPAVVSWEEWENSSEGQSCLDGSATGQYLRNRLWRAFMSAWNDKR